LVGFHTIQYVLAYIFGPPRVCWLLWIRFLQMRRVIALMRCQLLKLIFVLFRFLCCLKLVQLFTSLRLIWNYIQKLIYNNFFISTI